jgi:hypothetical protein
MVNLLVVLILPVALVVMPLRILVSPLLAPLVVPFLAVHLVA